MSCLFGDIYEAIRTLRICKGTTEKCIMNYMEERVGGCLGVAHTLKTIRTLHKLVEDGVLVKRGKRYLLPPKPKCKRKKECEMECPKVEKDECDECEELESEEEEDDCDDDEDDEEFDDDEDDDDDDDECDENALKTDAQPDELKPINNKSPKDLGGEISRAINNNNKPILNTRPNKEDNYGSPLVDRHNDTINKCLSGKSNGKANVKCNSNKPLGKSVGKPVAKAMTRKDGNVKAVKNENEAKKSSKTKPDIESRKNGTGKTKQGAEELNKSHMQRKRESRIKKKKMKHNDSFTNKNCERPDNVKSSRSRSPIKGIKNNAYQTLNLNHSIDLCGHLFQEAMEPDAEIGGETGDNSNMDYELFHQRNSCTPSYSDPSGPLLNKKESSGSDLAENKFQEDIKMDAVFEGKTQDTFVHTLDSQNSVTGERFNSDGEKVLADETMAKGDLGTSLCSVCEKKKRSS